MKILKPGSLMPRKFVCNKCNCVFVADNKEYGECIDYSDWPFITYRIACPCCGLKLRVGSRDAPLYTEEQENENKDNY